MVNPSRLDKIQITGNSNSGTATKVNVQEANGEVNTQTINTGFNKNIGLGGSDVVGANTLLNQYSATPSDWTAQTYTLGSVVFYGGKQWIAKIATVAGDVPNSSSKWEEITFEALANKTVIVDAIPTGGSNNAVSSNGVFDALATKAPISSVHNPVTLGTANGLSLSTQQLSLGLASSGVTGALSGTDWNTFNGKFNTPSGLTTNYLPKWNGSGFGNSGISDNGSNVKLLLPTEVPYEKDIYFGNRTGLNYGIGVYFNQNTQRLIFYDGLGGANLLQINRDNSNIAQFNGTISASPAVSPNQVVVKSQLDAVGRPYKVYTALLSQSGTGIPTAIVLENTTGETPTFSRVNIGNYQISLTVPQTKTFVTSTASNNNYINAIGVNGLGTGVNIYTSLPASGGGSSPQDSLLNKTPIEIRIYP